MFLHRSNVENQGIFPCLSEPLLSTGFHCQAVVKLAATRGRWDGGGASVLFQTGSGLLAAVAASSTFNLPSLSPSAAARTLAVPLLAPRG